MNSYSVKCLLIVIGVVSYSLTGSVEAVTPEGFPEEAVILLDFKKSITNDPTGGLISWNSASTKPCTWASIICNEDGHVLYIAIDQLRLEGSLSPSLANLTFLKGLDVHKNFLSGEVPAALAAMPTLTQVKLHINNFTGQIPSEFGRPTLRFLVAYSNMFSGPIPSTFANATGLKTLDLHDNKLTGLIPPSVGSFQNLTILRLSQNNFTGPIPAEIGNSEQLLRLEVHENQLSGALPSSLGKLSQLGTLRLDGNVFSGEIPSAIFNMASLANLTLQNNAFSGILPPGISALKQLELLNLSSNQLSGPLPSDIGELPALVSLDLHNNNFSGILPDSIGQLQNVTYIDLSGNPALTGFLPTLLFSLPHLQNLTVKGDSFKGPLPTSLPPTLATFDFSSNFFSGNVPAYLGEKLTDRNFTSLDGNCLEANISISTCAVLADGVCYLSNQRPASQCVPALKGDDDNHNRVRVIIILAVFGFCTIMAGIGGAEFFLQKKDENTFVGSLQSVNVTKRQSLPLESVVVKKRSTGSSGSTGSRSFWSFGRRAAEGGSSRNVPQQLKDPSEIEAVAEIEALGVTKFDMYEIRTATNNFTDRVGIGSTGTTYRGTLSDGTLAAFKVLKAQTRSQELERLPDAQFLAAIKGLALLQHAHLAKFVGYSMGEGVRVLVHEYVPGGSLYDALHERHSQPLSWHERMGIALGVACGLDYLHNQAYPAVVHQDVKSGNVLLTDNLAAKLSDVCTLKEALLGPDGNPLASAMSPRGSFGYLDPEYAQTRTLTAKSDVYAFGVLLFELISGQRAMNESATSVLVYIQDFLVSRERLSQMVDFRIPPDSVAISELEATVAVAQACTRADSSKRPTMSDVKQALIERLGITPAMVSPIQEEIMEPEELPSGYTESSHTISSEYYSSA